MAWFTAEHAALLAAVQLAAATGLAARDLAAGLGPEHVPDRRGSWDDHARIQHAALERRPAQRRRRRGGPRGARPGPRLRLLRPVRRGGWPQFRAGPAAVRARSATTSGRRASTTASTWLCRARPAARRGARPRPRRPASCTARPATGRARPWPSTTSASATPSSATIEQAIELLRAGPASIQELGERGWEAATWDSLGYIHQPARRLPALGRVLRAVGAAVPGRSATASTRPTPWTTSATRSSPRVTPTAPGHLAAGRCASTRRSAIPTATWSGPSCTVRAAAAAATPRPHAPPPRGHRGSGVPEKTFPARLSTAVAGAGARHPATAGREYLARSVTRTTGPALCPAVRPGASIAAGAETALKRPETAGRDPDRNDSTAWHRAAGPEPGSA